MLFSILVAHYNNYNYFLDCYKSIQNQTFQNFEVIIVDDCSSDDSFEKIIELTKNDSRFKLYRNDENKGVGFTKRRCVELASGEICGFVDPDDTLAKDALEISLENHKENNVAVYSQFYICDNQLNINGIFQPSRIIKNKDKNFFNIFYQVSHFFTFKKSAYDSTTGINPTFTSAVDQDLYLKLYEIGNFKFVKKPLYFYRLHEKGVSQEKSKKEKLYQNWHQAILDTLTKRNITKLYGKSVSEITNLPKFIFRKQNTPFKRILRKFDSVFN